LLALLDLLDAARVRPDALIVVEQLAERFFSYCIDLAPADRPTSDRGAVRYVASALTPTWQRCWLSR
jgi:hypothetical protein